MNLKHKLNINIPPNNIKYLEIPIIEMKGG